VNFDPKAFVSLQFKSSRTASALINQSSGNLVTLICVVIGVGGRKKGLVLELAALKEQSISEGAKMCLHIFDHFLFHVF